jgi:hypothetical protein
MLSCCIVGLISNVYIMIFKSLFIDNVSVPTYMKEAHFYDRLFIIIHISCYLSKSICLNPFKFNICWQIFLLVGFRHRVCDNSDF